MNPHEEQRAELERVEDRIAPLVLEFTRTHRVFRMDDLFDAVRLVAPHIAPDSPSRILRQLRRKRIVNYEVVNRRQSLYRITDFDRLF